MLHRILRASQRLLATGQLSGQPSPFPLSVVSSVAGHALSFRLANDGIDGDPRQSAMARAFH
jgi:hypothetical protein